MFQEIFIYGLSGTENIDLKQEALLLCNNLLGLSSNMAIKIMSWEQVVNAAMGLNCKEQEYFQKLMQYRKEEIESMFKY